MLRGGGPDVVVWHGMSLSLWAFIGVGGCRAISSRICHESPSHRLRRADMGGGAGTVATLKAGWGEQASLLRDRGTAVAGEGFSTARECARTLMVAHLWPLSCDKGWPRAFARGDRPGKYASTILRQGRLPRQGRPHRYMVMTANVVSTYDLGPSPVGLLRAEGTHPAPLALKRPSA